MATQLSADWLGSIFIDKKTPLSFLHQTSTGMSNVMTKKQINYHAFLYLRNSRKSLKLKNRTNLWHWSKRKKPMKLTPWIINEMFRSKMKIPWCPTSNILKTRMMNPWKGQLNLLFPKLVGSLLTPMSKPTTKALSAELATSSCLRLKEQSIDSRQHHYRHPKYFPRNQRAKK